MEQNNIPDYYQQKRHQINKDAFNAILQLLEEDNAITLDLDCQVPTLAESEAGSMECAIITDVLKHEGSLLLGYMFFPTDEYVGPEELDTNAYPSLYQSLAQMMELPNPDLYVDEADKVEQEARQALVELLSKNPERAELKDGLDMGYSLLQTNDDKLISTLILGVRLAQPGRPDEEIPEEEQLEFLLDFDHRGGGDTWLRLDGEHVMLDGAAYPELYRQVVENFDKVKSSEGESYYMHEVYDMDMRFDGFDGDDYYE